MRKTRCTCGQCHTCRHREHVARWRRRGEGRVPYVRPLLKRSKYRSIGGLFNYKDWVDRARFMELDRFIRDGIIPPECETREEEMSRADLVAELVARKLGRAAIADKLGLTVAQVEKVCKQAA